MTNSSFTETRVRFAPSPTGYLHVGGARTALYCYLFAKKEGGEFVLRIEDTDEERSTEESMRMQIGDLQWLGLQWDEGVHPETLEDQGDYGPYRQSQRKLIYREYAERLLNEGHAYYCFMSDAEVEEQREKSKQEGGAIRVTSPYRELPLKEARAKLAAGDSAVVRFKVPEEIKSHSIHDLVRGEVSWQSDMVGDFVLLRSGGMPVYNFCCVIDDALMKISHVFRAEDHLNNTLRQLMIYEALKFPLPQFAHMSFILGEDKQKLSKRHGATSITDFKLKGYCPEAINNFIALLGWSSPEGAEILSMEELKSQFSVDRLNSAPAVFDSIKLKWVNAMHLRAMPHQELWEKVSPFLKEAGLDFPDEREWIDRSLGLLKVAMETYQDAVELFRPLDSSKFTLNEEGREVLGWEVTSKVVQSWRDQLAGCGESYLTEDLFKTIQNRVKAEAGVKGRELFQPIRVAVIGKPSGSDLQTLVQLLS
ncbi:glutamate--tRNA ligase, partial [Bdellovibrionales bacterium]|nr:glutamate--tRNA ligase [Bdellovibrionales bacterium]